MLPILIECKKKRNGDLDVRTSFGGRVKLLNRPFYSCVLSCLAFE